MTTRERLEPPEWKPDRLDAREQMADIENDAEWADRKEVRMAEISKEMLALVDEATAKAHNYGLIETSFRYKKAEDARAALISAIANLERDAKRYRWLRQYNVDSYLAIGSGDHLDYEIDMGIEADKQSVTKTGDQP
jgi:hypothetical protein